MSYIFYNFPVEPGTVINPTNDLVPVRQDADTFRDSHITDTSLLTKIQLSTGIGVEINKSSDKCTFGILTGAGTNTFIQVRAGVLSVNGTLISTTIAGVSSGTYLLITVNGTPYKLDLLT